MKPLTLEQVFERIDKSLFDGVELHESGLDDVWVELSRKDNFLAELSGEGDIKIYLFDENKHIPQLLEIQRCQRLLLVGEEE